MISRFVLLIVVPLSSPVALFGEVGATKQKAFNVAIQRNVGQFESLGILEHRKASRSSGRVLPRSRLAGTEMSLLYNF